MAGKPTSDAEERADSSPSLEMESIDKHYEIIIRELKDREKYTRIQSQSVHDELRLELRRTRDEILKLRKALRDQRESMQTRIDFLKTEVHDERRKVNFLTKFSDISEEELEYLMEEAVPDKGREMEKNLEGAKGKQDLEKAANLLHTQLSMGVELEDQRKNLERLILVQQTHLEEETHETIGLEMDQNDSEKDTTEVTTNQGMEGACGGLQIEGDEEKNEFKKS